MNKSEFIKNKMNGVIKDIKNKYEYKLNTKHTNYCFNIKRNGNIVVEYCDMNKYEWTIFKYVFGIVHSFSNFDHKYYTKIIFKNKIDGKIDFTDIENIESIFNKLEKLNYIFIVDNKELKILNKDTFEMKF